MNIGIIDAEIIKNNKELYNKVFKERFEILPFSLAKYGKYKGKYGG